MKLLNLFFRENSSTILGKTERKRWKQGMQDVPQSSRELDPTPVKTVLIVEDDADIAEVLLTLLQVATTYQVIHMFDGCAALKMVRTLLPHLVLLDYGLPSMYGLECLDLLRASKGMQQTPVILMSAAPPQISRRVLI